MADIGTYGRRLYLGYVLTIRSLGISHMQGSPLLIAVLGLLVSFVGSLPVGVLNVSSLYWSSTSGMDSALQFAAAVVVVEGSWAFAALYFSRKLGLEGRWKTGMIFVTFFLLIYLAYMTYQRSYQPIDAMEVPVNGLSLQVPWIMGLVLSALNPFQVPFWLLWHHFFRENRWLTNEYWNQASYIASIIAGSFLALTLYALLGYMLQDRLQPVIAEFQRVLALAFGLFALYFLYAGYKHMKTVTTR